MKKIATKLAAKAVTTAIDAVTLSHEQRDRLVESLPAYRAWVPQPSRCELGYAAPPFECDALLPDRTVGKIRSCDYYATPEADETSGKDALGDRKKAGNMWVLLLFYPADFSFVCATELIALSAAAERFRRECNCQVIACSTDTVYAHRAWCSLPRSKGGLSLNDGNERRFEQPLGFPLLADVSRAVSRDFGVLFPADSEHAGMSMSGTFLIDPNGLVRHVAIQEMSIARNIPELLRLTHGYVRHAATGELLPHGWRVGTPGVRTKEMMEVGQSTTTSVAQSEMHQQLAEARQDEAPQGLLSKLSNAIFGGDAACGAAASAAEVSGTEATQALAAAKSESKGGRRAAPRCPVDAANRAKEGTHIHDMISSLDLKHTPNLAPKRQTPTVANIHPPHPETVNATAILSHHSPAPHAIPTPPPPVSSAAMMNISPYAIRKTDDAAKAHLSLAGGPTLKGVTLAGRGRLGDAAAAAPMVAAAAVAAPRATSYNAKPRAEGGATTAGGYPGAAAATSRRAASAGREGAPSHMVWPLTNAAILDYDDVGAGGPYFSAIRQRQHVIEASLPIVDDDAAHHHPHTNAPQSTGKVAEVNAPTSAGRSTAPATRATDTTTAAQRKNQPAVGAASWAKVETEIPAAFGGADIRKVASPGLVAAPPETRGSAAHDMDVDVWRSGSGTWKEGGHDHTQHHSHDGEPVRVAAMSPADPEVRKEVERHTHHA